MLTVLLLQVGWVIFTIENKNLFNLFLVEIEQMLNEELLQSYPCSAFDWPWSERNEMENCNVYAHENSTSGGYSEYIFKYAAKELFNQEVEIVEFKSLR